MKTVHQVPPQIPAVRCRLCGKTFSFGLPIIGEIKERKLQRFGNSLAQHMMTTHSDKFQEISARMQILMGHFVSYLGLAEWDVIEPDLQQSMEESRRLLKACVMGPVPTDEKLREKAAECFTRMAEAMYYPDRYDSTDSTEHENCVLEYLAELRDVMQEKIPKPLASTIV